VKLRLIFFTFFFLLTSTIFAQFPSLPANLGNVRSSDITEEQLGQIATYIRQNNISSQQTYELLIRRGMNPTEASNLRDRLDRQPSDTQKDDKQDVDKDDKEKEGSAKSREKEGRTFDTTLVEKTKEVANPKKIFGLEIFNNGVLTFEPNLRIATPVGYILGPDDEINLNIYGYQEAKYTLRVGPEGDINIPYAGVMYVGGLTIEQATAKIKAKLAASGYANIRTGLTKVNVTVGRIRSIKVTILGEVRKPGTYTLPSLATAFNALYLSGGPNDIGSLRNIEIIRNGKIIDHLDIYDFLVKGNQSGNLNLRDQDVIRIPAYKVRVSLEGEVKRTGLFEIKEGENLQNLFDFAGGFSDSAYTAGITAYKVTDIDKRIVDVPQSQFTNYKPTRSESFVVKKIVGRFVNRVSITGAVFLPGDYEWTEGMTLKNLIAKAQGLKEDAYGGRGIIIRNRNDLTPEYVPFSPAETMSATGNNIILKANDRVSITSVSELKETTTVSIAGEIREPGNYIFVEGMSLQDLILLAGGFTDAAAPQHIEVARRVKSSIADTSETRISDVLDVSSIQDLQSKGADVRLTSYDVVVVRKNPGYQQQVNVKVEGEVFFPGPYVLKTKNERISDVIKRAGGLTRQAYEQGGYISRVNNKTVLNQLNTEKINKMQETLKDTTGHVEKEVERPVDQIAIDLATIMANPGSKNDLTLEEGDVLTIPKEKMDVRISGQVLFPTRVVYDNKLELKDYLGRAGGLTDNARKGKIYVLYPNGNAAKTSSFLFFRSFPKVTAGAEVIVPKKHEVERRRLTTGEIIGITTAITSFAGVLLSVLINSK
jgi:protein involved in polysaccharide export with SLBB domain